MANTKSAEKRARQSERRRVRNRGVKTHLRTLEKQLQSAIASGEKDTAGAALRKYSSAYDKAVKGGVVRRETANRKKSRLAVRMNTVK